VKLGCSAECARRVTVAHTQPPITPTMTDVRPAPPVQRAASTLADVSVDVALPPLPIPEGPFERPGFRPIARAANLLTNLVGRW
jgi:hypothetical protein